MLRLNFGPLAFYIQQDKIYLKGYGDFTANNGGNFVEVHITGENKDSHGAKMLGSSEGKKLCYYSHEIIGDKLVIIQRSDLIEVRNIFFRYKKTNAVRVFAEVKNISTEEVVLEEVSSIKLTGIGDSCEIGAQDLYFTKFLQGTTRSVNHKHNLLKNMG